MVTATTSGSTLTLAKGGFALNDFSYGLTISVSLTIRGVKHGVDARGRSTTGSNVASYTGAADSEESTITCNCHTVIYVTAASNVILDGLTITSTYNGGDPHFGIKFYYTSAQSTQSHIVRNTVIRHLGNPTANIAGTVTGLYVGHYSNGVTIFQNEIRDLSVSAAIRGI